MLDWQELALLPEPELARYSVAEVNLACAVGLPGSEKIDVDFCRGKLDWLVQRVGQNLSFARAAFRDQPGHWDNSWGVCRIHTLLRVLQREGGVRYNAAKMADDAPFSTEDTFIHGVLQGEGGTCGSVPVVYAAVGRRLGFPIKLVRAKCHLFARWEGEGERFNIEVNNDGFGCPADDYYRQGRYEIDPVLAAQACMLESMSPKEEFGDFLAQRAYRWLDLGKHREAAEAFIWASVVDPRNKLHGAMACAVLRRWKKRLQGMMPPHFPEMIVTYPARRFPTIPQSVERQFITCEVLDDCLQHPSHRLMWWEPQRRSPERRLPQIPQIIGAFLNR